jgi:hypothetical protein
MLTLIFWKWHTPHYEPYPAERVNIAASMVRRHYPDPLRIVCITDDPLGVECETIPLWQDAGGLHNACGAHLPSCYRRLKLFAREMHKTLGCEPGDPVISLDLDMAVTGDLRPVWNPHLKSGAPFVGWMRKGPYHERVWNGSMWLLRLGSLPEVWEEFEPVRSPRAALLAGFMGSDQAWMRLRLGEDRPAWTNADGVYHFGMEVHPQRMLPANAKLVMFCGLKRKPWYPEVQAQHPWIKDHYHA